MSIDDDTLDETVTRLMRNLPGPWVDEALCAEVGGDLWFPEKGDNPTAAVTMCRRCPVAAECLDHALVNNEHHGVWGGVSTKNRQRLRRAEPGPAA